MGEAITAVLRVLAIFFQYALIAVFMQNAIFSRALGVSRLVKLVDDEAVDSLTFCLLLCAIQCISAPLAYGINFILLDIPSVQMAYVRPLVMVGCALVAFVVVLLLVVTLLRPARAKKVAAVLPMATFNCTVMGAMLVTQTQSFTLAQTMGFALGTGLGYLLAVFLVDEGERKFAQGNVPKMLQGLPIMLLYIGILALALYGFIGHMITF